MEAVTVNLRNCQLWAYFDNETTEMIITKQGRRMFPTLEFSIDGLQPDVFYDVELDFEQVGNQAWRFEKQRRVWCPHSLSLSNRNEDAVHVPKVSSAYAYPECPTPGAMLMRSILNFGKLKLSNSSDVVNGQISLVAGLKWRPRLHVLHVDLERTSNPDLGSVFRRIDGRCYTFANTEFITVTAYHNPKLVDLKVTFNPFASGIRKMRSAVRDDDAVAKSETAPIKRQRQAAANVFAGQDASALSSPNSSLSQLESPQLSDTSGSDPTIDLSPPAALNVSYNPMAVSPFVGNGKGLQQQQQFGGQYHPLSHSVSSNSIFPMQPAYMQPAYIPVIPAQLERAPYQLAQAHSSSLAYLPFYHGCGSWANAAGGYFDMHNGHANYSRAQSSSAVSKHNGKEMRSQLQASTVAPCYQSICQIPNELPDTRLIVAEVLNDIATSSAAVPAPIASASFVQT